MFKSRSQKSAKSKPKTPPKPTFKESSGEKAVKPRGGEIHQPFRLQRGQFIEFTVMEPSKCVITKTGPKTYTLDIGPVDKVEVKLIATPGDPEFNILSRRG